MKAKEIKKTIAERYFNELKTSGHTVPRFESSGEVIPMKVGQVYLITHPSGPGVIKAKCTQDCPTHLVKL